MRKLSHSLVSSLVRSQHSFVRSFAPQLTRSLVCTRRSLIRLLRIARFARSRAPLHSFVSSLTRSRVHEKGRICRHKQYASISTHSALNHRFFGGGEDEEKNCRVIYYDPRGSTNEKNRGFYESISLLVDH